ncbi:hypothetical protein ACGF0D_33650 [Kitasatospora sp. NPDC048298]|uniref:hypothetical protein n=1 Tax=Kitasatospora sp. NPDC048298 TaxID=3364049 RepID=UPI00371D9EC5
MTDMNNPNRGDSGDWPQQPHPQQRPYPPQGQQPYFPPQQPGPQPPYGYPVDDAATAVLPPVPAFDDAAATTLLPPVPAVDDAATAVLPPVPAVDDAEATALLPPVVVSGSTPVAPPRHQQQPQYRQQAPQHPQYRQQPPQHPQQQASQQPQYRQQAPQHPQQQASQQPQYRQQAPQHPRRRQPEQPVQPQPDPTIQLQQPPRPRARHAAPAPQPAPVPQPAEAFDPPTMTLKRPPVPGLPGPQGQGAPAYAAAPPQAVPPAGPRGRPGSPIIDPGLQPALITAGAAALLAGGAALGQVALALVVALLQLLTAAGWFRLNGMWPARQGILLAALAGFTADAAVLLADSDGGVAAVVGTLGGFFLLVLVLQTFRPSDPKERFYALTVLGSATVVTALCTTLLLADWVPAAVGAVALATLLAAAPLPGPKQLGPVLGLAAAVALGLLVGAPVALGALAGLGALVGRRVAAYDFPSRFVHMTAGVALPLAVAAPLIWIATELLA